MHGLSCERLSRNAGQLPRALLTDNGSAMLAHGRDRSKASRRDSASSDHDGPALARSKTESVESFWGQIEGRSSAHARGRSPSSRSIWLNTATQAWVEQEHQRQGALLEIREAPLDRYLRGPSVGRESPGSDALRRAMRTEVSRKQRRSDGTVTVEGVRFEIPAAYRTLLQLRLRVARWGLLASVDLVDPRSGDHLTTLPPIDKGRNAERVRRASLQPTRASSASPRVGTAPHLRALMADYAATGLPPAYLPQHRDDEPPEDSMTKLLSALRTLLHPFRPDVPTEVSSSLPPPSTASRPTRSSSASPMAASPCSPAIRGRARASPCAFSPSAFAPCPMSWSAPSSIPRAAPWTSIASLGDLFSVPLAAHNRWAGFKALRTRWADHIGSSRCRPVLIIDEAQEALTPVLCELRILASKELDSVNSCSASPSSLAMHDCPSGFVPLELQPLGSRIRRRLTLDFASRDELLACLDHLPRRRRQSDADDQRAAHHPGRPRRRKLPRAHESRRRAPRRRRRPRFASPASTRSCSSRSSPRHPNPKP